MARWSSLNEKSMRSSSDHGPEQRQGQTIVKALELDLHALTDLQLVLAGTCQTGDQAYAFVQFDQADRVRIVERRHLGVVHDDKGVEDRKSTRLNSSHVRISYAVFCLKKK